MNKSKKILILAVTAVLLVCIAIGIALGLLLNRHSHTFSEEWSADENYHWHAATCEHTEEVKTRASTATERTAYAFAENNNTNIPRYGRPTKTIIGTNSTGAATG